MTRCRTCGVLFKPVGRGVYCGRACRCGTDAGYQGGCRCVACKTAHARSSKRYRVLGGAAAVPVLGATRRVDALACLGWSRQELSRRLGRDKSYLSLALRGATITPETFAAIARLYDALSMTWCTSPAAARTAANARTRGVAPPLAWDDAALDDPAALLYGHAARQARATSGDFDVVVVERILAGEHHLPATRAERLEVAARWAATGRSLTDLERLTGWNTARDRRLHTTAA